MEELKKSIIRTVAYFDIFHYPMTLLEIRSYIDMPCTEQALYLALSSLMKEKILFKTKEHYLLKHDDSVISERLKANALAEKQIITAKKIAAFLAWFPFIKGIAISGSLSKKIATKKSDYDFFIITEENYLWLCKLIFSVFIKLAGVFGLKKYFCLNYVVDEFYLEVHEKNVFTATEIATLIPVYGGQIFIDFFAANNWIYDFFPNHTFIQHYAIDKRKNFFTRAIEKIFRNKTGQKADNAIMHYFDKRWQKLKAKKHTTKSGFILGSMMVDKHYCKPYPQFFQQKVLLMLGEKIQKINKTLTTNTAY